MFSHFSIDVIVFYLTVISLLCSGNNCGRIQTTCFCKIQNNLITYTQTYLVYQTEAVLVQIIIYVMSMQF